MFRVESSSNVREDILDQEGLSVVLAGAESNCSNTHIVCTLGPASRTVATVSSMLNAGMNIARFNFSHGSHDYHSETLSILRQSCEATNKFCGVLLDTKGPEIRTVMNF